MTSFVKPTIRGTIRPSTIRASVLGFGGGGGGGIPPNALLDRDGNPVLDRDGNYILTGR